MIKLFTSWLLLTALSVNVVATHTTDARDQVVASFERELNHEPVPARDVRRDDIDDDLLYALVNDSLLAAADKESDESNDEGEEK